MKMKQFWISLFAAVMTVVVIHEPTRAAQVNWSTDVEAALQQANQSGSLVFMKFTADWCGYCKKMERETFSKPAVAELVNQNFVPVLVNADQHKPLVEHLQIRGLPAMLVVSPEMVILEKISGYQTEAKLLPVLQKIVAKHPRSQAPAIAGKTTAAAPPTRPVSQQQLLGPTRATGAAGTAKKPSHPAVYDEPAFGGLCLPAVNETRSLVSGMPQLAFRYHGKTLYFSSPEHLAKFKATPEKYWPQKDGNCPVTLAGTGEVVEGQLEYAAVFRGKLWVMRDAEAMASFVASPARYVDAVTAE
ncbi:MAG: thioredoxin family protein [Fuerstiella sp.]